jgi:hypothetical protein
MRWIKRPHRVSVELLVVNGVLLDTYFVNGLRAVSVFYCATARFADAKPVIMP